MAFVLAWILRPEESNEPIVRPFRAAVLRAVRDSRSGDEANGLKVPSRELDGLLLQESWKL